MSDYQSGYEEFVEGQYQISVKLRQTRGGNESMYGKTPDTTQKKCIKCGDTSAIAWETTDEGLLCLDCALGGESNG